MCGGSSPERYFWAKMRGYGPEGFNPPITPGGVTMAPVSSRCPTGNERIQNNANNPNEDERPNRNQEAEQIIDLFRFCGCLKGHPGVRLLSNPLAGNDIRCNNCRQ